MLLELSDLPYAHDALSPYMSAETLELHHDKHHLAYVTNGNALVEANGVAGISIENTMIDSFDNGAGGPLFNNVAQHWNHTKFWGWMKPNGGGSIPGSLEKLLIRDFGSVAKFEAAFINAGVSQFGSGWCWLVVDESGTLSVCNTPYAVNPIVTGTGSPLLGCDVWEHSYYVDYRNRRPEYLEAFIRHLVNWERVAEDLNDVLN